MKKKRSYILHILLLVVIFDYSYASLKIDILNFPESINSNTDTTLIIEVKNIGNDTIIVKKSQKCINILILDNNDKIFQKSSNSNEIEFCKLAPGRSFKEPIIFSLTTFKDTMICPKANYTNCHNGLDSIIAGCVGMCGNRIIKTPLKPGKYKVSIMIDIVDFKNKNNSRLRSLIKEILVK